MPYSDQANPGKVPSPLDSQHGRFRVRAEDARPGMTTALGWRIRGCRIARVESWSARREAAQDKGENMKTLFAGVLLAATLAGFGAAEAAQGCGPGFHRGPYGGCRPNGGAVIVAPRVVAPRIVVAPAPVVVVRPGRVCPYGFAWRYGRCRPI